jgi:serine/threonine protein phosphatase PrpC
MILPTQNPPTRELPLTIASRTDVGKVRSANEDSYLVVIPEDPLAAERRGRLVVVADGMGGAVGGAHASRMVVETLSEAMYSDHGFPPEQALSESIQLANRNIHSEASARLEMKGMGSTCTAMLLLHDRAYIGHVGDSRAYLVRQGRILALTDDHTKVQLLLDSGMITPAEAEVHPERSVLIRSIGPKPTVEVDVLEPVELEDGDRLVLCSDGLTNHVSDGEILQLSEDHAPAEAVDRLVKLAKERGGTDNITVHVVGVGRPRARPAAPQTVIERPAPPTIPPTRARGGRPAVKAGTRLSWVMMILAGLGGIALGVAIFAGVMSWSAGRSSGGTERVEGPAPPAPPVAAPEPVAEPEPTPDPAAMTPVAADVEPAEPPKTYAVRVRPKRNGTMKNLQNFRWRLRNLGSDTTYVFDPDKGSLDIEAIRAEYVLECQRLRKDDWFTGSDPTTIGDEAHFRGEVTFKCSVSLEDSNCDCK